MRFNLLLWLVAAAMSSVVMSLQGREEDPNGLMRCGTQFDIATAVAAAGSDTTNPGRPVVATDGTDYLVVYRRTLDQPMGMFASLLRADGQIVRTVLVSNPGFSPSATFDGTNYLVVYSRSGLIYGTRLNRAGMPLGELQVSSGEPLLASNDWPVAAFDGQRYLVAWMSYATWDWAAVYDIMGARVDSEGRVLNEFPISRELGYQVFPSVASAGDNSLVVWRDSRPGAGGDNDVWGARISPAGAVLDPGGFPICTQADVQEDPVVTYGAGNYFVAWVDNRGTGQPAWAGSFIYGVRVRPDGTLLDGPPERSGVPITSLPGSSWYPALASDGRAYYTVWEVEGPSPSERAGIFFAQVTSAGLPADGPAEWGGIPVGASTEWGSNLAYGSIACAGKRLLITWLCNAQLMESTKKIQGAFIDLDHVPQQPAWLELRQPQPTAGLELVLAGEPGCVYLLQSAPSLAAAA
ncbi:MAG: hypothetical protein M5U12_32840 [Verrucomicrobia bacterium]|nr:hypothetical protein [Verrucomicrobiota bacterium]